ncbi:sigma-54-dependent transcriptional regulator [Haloflavibacter putidus]|uniref:Sigma-54-dependent Fis family transcriptional regulator n=1 Tax=Haloflavibacter putidus TaxID=2576776 RepID=A0A507ZPJ4_9FLAO|nr:sigma-54 dependent transcriptional regulator [Haloflavibacter putidus]TQD38501.1 sigma-54-dependent Fis family transcriptional regulator [Haloflavibacter putidus]
MNNILLVEDDVAFCKMLENFLTKKGYAVDSCFSTEEALNLLEENTYQLILTDVRLPEKEGTAVLDLVNRKGLKTPVILMTSYAEVDKAVEVMKKGALDYISKPINPEKLLNLVEKATQTTPAEPKKSSVSQREKTATSVHFVECVSDASKKLNNYIRLVAPTPMSVLIIGESGTGKEYVAKKIHKQSKRKEEAFIAVDCGAIPKEIASSEFFGHIKGSFTGAIQDKIGHFKAADKGTLFLDEIGNLNYDLQMQLLRALQERKIKPVGSNQEIEVDIRVITATNEDLKKAVEAGNFRQDLYHRLNEFSIEVPALKNRKEDLPLFANYFLEKANAELDKNIIGFTEEALAVFSTYAWPGNLREMQNSIKRAVLLTEEKLISKENLPQELLQNNAPKESYGLFKNKNEETLILQALEQADGNKSKAARLLEIDRKTLYNKLKQYDIDL